MLSHHHSTTVPCPEGSRRISLWTNRVTCAKTTAPDIYLKPYLEWALYRRTQLLQLQAPDMTSSSTRSPNSRIILRRSSSPPNTRHNSRAKSARDWSDYPRNLGGFIQLHIFTISISSHIWRSKTAGHIYRYASYTHRRLYKYHSADFVQN